MNRTGESALAQASTVPFESIPNSIFMSMRAQSLAAHAFSSTSNMTSAVRRMISTSSCPIISPFNLNCADTICSSDHCGSWFASSYKSHNDTRKTLPHTRSMLYNFILEIRVIKNTPIQSAHIQTHILMSSTKCWRVASLVLYLCIPD